MLNIVNFIDKSFLSVYNSIFVKSRFTTWTWGEFISAELEFNIYSSSKFFTFFFTFFNVSFFYLPFFYYPFSNFVVDSTYESACHGKSSSFVACLLDVNFTVGYFSDIQSIVYHSNSIAQCIASQEFLYKFRMVLKWSLNRDTLSLKVDFRYIFASFFCRSQVLIPW